MLHPRRYASPVITALVMMLARSLIAQNPPAAPSMFRGSPAASAHLPPLSTSVAGAEEHFAMGIRDFDAEKNSTARQHFAEAIKADPSFALAHLYAAFADLSPAGYKAHLGHATSNAAAASPAERLMITIAERDYANDLNGRLAAANELVKVAPDQPRAYLEVARAQFTLGRTADGRQSLMKAIELSPDFTAVHVELANSYFQQEPRDLVAAESHLGHALALEPNAPYVHDYMGDLYRAKNELDKARTEYTKVAELDPSSPNGFQQRGHVNAFLGNYAEARADYDRGTAKAETQQKPGFMVLRAIVSVYAGDPASAEREIEAVYNAVDGMNLPNPDGAKINAMNEQFLIAVESRHFDVAQRAMERIATLSQKQAQIAGTPERLGVAKAVAAYNAGFLAIRKGDFATGRAKAQEYMDARKAENNPRKNEGAHGLMALADYFEGHAESSLVHFDEVSPDNQYYNYYHALALEKAGKTAEAQVLFKRVASRNFSTAAVALTKKSAASHLKP
jgi:Tfp pilus assembly protein PilF